MNINKPGDLMRDRKKWGWVCVCLSICLWAGCRQEVEAPDPLEKGMFLTYKSGDTYGEGGASVHYAAFAGKTESNKEWKSNGSQNGLSGKVPLQGDDMLNDVYMVINPDNGLAGKLARIHDKNSLAAVQIQSASLPDNVDISTGQRYHFFENVYVQPDGTVTYGKYGAVVDQVNPIQGKFLMAKARVEFKIASESDMTVSGTKFVIQSVQLKDLPVYSYLIPKVFDGNGTIGKNFSSLTPAAPGATSYMAEAEVLMPEYIRGTSPDAKKVMLVVTAQRWKNGQKLGTSEYELPVGNAMTSGAADPDDYDIDRNKVYTFSFTRVGGAGTEVDDWKVDKRVSDWENRNIPTIVSDADGLFLETSLIENFRSFRLPRYVRFRATGKGSVTVEYPRDENGVTVKPNDFYMMVLWDDDSHKSGKLALKKGNWRTVDNFNVSIRLYANNIEKVLVVKTVPAKFASQGITEMKYTWLQAMNYTYNMSYLQPKDMTDDRLISEYSRANGTGCADYYEGSADDPLTGKGCWRVSTIREGLRYMYDNKIQDRIWAYEMEDNSYNTSYTSRIPPIIDERYDWHHPSGENFPPESRTSTEGVKMLCVLDDKLEKYYNIGVNAKDYPGDVDFRTAKAICFGLTEGGYTDWRLPTAQESGYALLNGGTQGIPNNFDASLYWLDTGVAAGVGNPGGTSVPPGGVANVRCVRTKWLK